MGINFGEVFGRLFVIQEVPKSVSTNGRKNFICLCECGTLTSVIGHNLRNGDTKSCGCLFIEKITKHGHNPAMGCSPTYRSWSTMVQRCTNSNNTHYEYYGGRGIAICERWLLFENFLADMGERPEGFTLERVDNNGNYCYENCKWADKSMQGFNQRLRKTNKSGRTGVSEDPRGNGWLARIMKDGKNIYLGKYSLYEDAVKARECAELDYFGIIKK